VIGDDGDDNDDGDAAGHNPAASSDVDTDESFDVEALEDGPRRSRRPVTSKKEKATSKAAAAGLDK
jgi:hypothetical protein